MLTEAARPGPESTVLKATPKNDDEHISLFWRVFGGTILSMVALGAITLYNNISSNIAELRADINHEREARAELVKKDEFNNRSNAQYERVRSFEGLKADFEGLKERVNGNAAALDCVKKDSLIAVEAIKKELDATKKDAAAVEVLKEKLATATDNLKAIREDLTKIQQEQERNRVAELERKASREVQGRLLEDSLKDLQKGLQDCREKLARLEGSRGTSASTETVPVPVRPVTPSESKAGPGDQGAGTSKPATSENASTSKPYSSEIPDGM